MKWDLFLVVAYGFHCETGHCHWTSQSLRAHMLFFGFESERCLNVGQGTTCCDGARDLMDVIPMMTSHGT